MGAKNKIRTALETIMTAGKAQACEIYKGHGFDGTRPIYGWWYRPFGQNPICLEKTLSKALAYIEDIEASQ